MPRRMMDYGMMGDGRNPYGSRGGYVSSRRMRRRGRDRAMGEDYADYDMDMARGRGRGGDRAGSDYGDMARGSGNYGDRAGRDYADYEDMARGGRGRDRASDYGDYAGDMARGGGRGRDRAGDYGDYESGDMARGGRDGHHRMMGGQGSTYYPIEAMGYFSGYYGGGEEDFARGGRGRGRDRAMNDYGMDYEYDMARGGRRDYGYDYGGEMLEEKEIQHWTKKLEKEVEEKDKQFFTKENIKKKAEEMGIKFDKFSMEEFLVTTLMMYTDYCKTLGTANMEIYLRLAKDWLCDEDAGVKYGEKLAVYYDNIVDPE